MICSCNMIRALICSSNSKTFMSQFKCFISNRACKNYIPLRSVRSVQKNCIETGLLEYDLPKLQTEMKDLR